MQSSRFIRPVGLYGLVVCCLQFMLLAMFIKQGDLILASDSESLVVGVKQPTIKPKQPAPLANQGDTSEQQSRKFIRERSQQRVRQSQTSMGPLGTSIRDNKSLAMSSGDDNSTSDSSRMAQLETRHLMGYENTPPVFVTLTRKFFVDVVRQASGSKITKIEAIDEEGDPIEFGIVQSNACDASQYFRIDSKTGELWITDRKLPHYLENQFDGWNSGSSNPVVNVNGGDISDDVEEEDDSEAVANVSTTTGLEQQAATCRNLYVLMIMASDGHFKSYLETLIHVTNSSALQSITGGSLVQLTPESSRRSQDRLENMMSLKRDKFRGPNPITTFPKYVNPGLVKPSEDLTSAPQSELTLSQQKTQIQASNSFRQSTPDASTPLPLAPTTFISSGSQISQPQHQSVENVHAAHLVPQPVQVSLVIIGSALTAALVLLIFIVPIKIRRLRKRLKQVETLHHERISNQNSNSGSSTMFSGSSSPMSRTVTGAPSLSQFTLGSLTTSGGDLGASRSVICRQSSLDSAIANHLHHQPGLVFHHNQPFHIANGELLNRVNNGSITNPVYLQQNFSQEINGNLHLSHQQFPHNSHLIQQQLHHNQQQQRYQQQVEHQDRYLAELTRHQSNHRQPIVEPQVGLKSGPLGGNLYYPLDDDDEMYSTIQTDSTCVGFNNSGRQQEIMTDTRQRQQHQMQLDQGQLDRHVDSRASTRSSSSIRALARFLSLPARQSNKTTGPNCNPSEVVNRSDKDELQSWNQTAMDFPNKTIARGSGIERENQRSSHSWELERTKLRFIKILDQGQFGLVWRCSLNPGTVGEKMVAVKTLKKTSVKEEREDLLAEIEIMKLVCGHPNVVRILHCCTANISNDSVVQNQLTPPEKPIYLVMEYLELGKLQSFLQNSRDKHHYATSISTTDANNNNNMVGLSIGNSLGDNNNGSCDGDEEEPDYGEQQVTSRDLLKFIYHVAKGMEYLSSQCIVHRDLASRNILVSSQRVCKIGDFGMARHMQSFGSVYERRSKNAKIPVRWMAPEVLLNNSFTTNSDVFSFGILMWEIITLGSTPYRHLRTEEVIEAVARRGERPAKPEYCHAELYRIMSRCWHTDPSERPTFSSLVKQLDYLMVSANNYIELDQYPDHDYYNVPETFAPLELL